MDARANQMTSGTPRSAGFVRNGLAGMLGLSERQVRVIAPSSARFRTEDHDVLSEEVLLPWVSMKLNRQSSG